MQKGQERAYLGLGRPKVACLLTGLIQVARASQAGCFSPERQWSHEEPIRTLLLSKTEGHCWEFGPSYVRACF